MSLDQSTLSLKHLSLTETRQGFALLALEYPFGKIYMGREAVNLFLRGGICPSPRATDSATRSFVYEKEQDYNYPIMELVLK